MAEQPNRGMTRQAAQSHRFQLCSIIDGTQKEIARRSLLGMVDVYNILPASIVERSACVKSFQASLQELISDCAAAETDGWQRLLSPRHTLYNHPLKEWWRWESAF